MEKIDNTLLNELKDLLVKEALEREVMNKKTLAKYLCCSESRINKLMVKDMPYYKMGGTVLFKKTKIDEYIEQFKRYGNN
jgi:excisionase family DNA binding protein